MIIYWQWISAIIPDALWQLKKWNNSYDPCSLGCDLSPEAGVMLLKQTTDTIAAIRNTADQLRHQQAGDTVTYVIAPQYQLHQYL